MSDSLRGSAEGAKARSSGAGLARRSSVAGVKLFVRRFVPECDFVSFASWLTAHGREVVPPWALPAIGFVACVRVGGEVEEPTRADRQMGSGHLPLAVAFGYRDGYVGAVTWVTARRGLAPRLALSACSLVVSAVERELERQGARLLISPTERPSLVKFMRRRGWRVAHEANVLLYRTVDEGGGEAVAGSFMRRAPDGCTSAGVIESVEGARLSADVASKQRGGMR